MLQDEKSDRAGGSFVRRTRQPLFEKDLLTAGNNILESMTVCVFKNKRELIRACLYLGALERCHNERGVNMALWEINGTMAIEGRARDDAVQAHAHLFFPRHMSKDERRSLEKIQYKGGRDERDDGRGEYEAPSR